MKAKKIKTSSEDGTDPYMRTGFWFKLDNQFWKKPYHLTISKNGYIDRVLESTDTANGRLDKYVRRLKGLAGGSLHHL